jgi:hypothetical protein
VEGERLLVLTYYLFPFALLLSLSLYILLCAFL